MWSTSDRHQILTIETLPIAQVGIESGLFKTLADNPARHWSTRELSESLGLDEALTYRLARHFFTRRLLRENPDFTYVATDITVWLATEAAQDFIRRHYQAAHPSVGRSQWRREGQEGDLEPVRDGPKRRQETGQSGESSALVHRHPATTFVGFMKGRRDNPKPWTNEFPINALLGRESLSQTRAIFVDVGGYMGDQCIALQQQLNKPAGCIILQDRASVVDTMDRSTLQDWGIGVMSHDFFDEQPIKHARAYFLRHILHDWSDEKSVQILTRLRDAMTHDSMILIDEIVLPMSQPPWHNAEQGDLKMMDALVATERNATQWRTLVSTIGLKIVKVYPYDKVTCDSVLVVVKV